MIPQESPQGNSDPRQGQRPRLDPDAPSSPRRSYSFPPRRAIIREAHRLWRTAGLVGSFIAVGWLVVALSLGFIMDAAYSHRVLPGSVLAGRDISGMTSADLAGVITQAQNEIFLDLTVGEVTKTITGADYGISVDQQQVMALALPDDREPLWIYRMRGEAEMPLTVMIDSRQFNKSAAADFPDAFQLPLDAGLVYDSTTQQFTLRSSEPGFGAPDTILSQIATLLASQSGRAAFELSPVPIIATITDGDAAETQTWLNLRLSQQYTLVYGEEDLYTLTKDDIAEMVSFGTDTAGELTAEFDSTAALSFVLNTLAPLVNSQPVDKAIITDPTGNIIEVAQHGQVGRLLANSAELAQSIVMRLTLGQDATIPVTFSTLSFDTENTVSLTPGSDSVAKQLEYLLAYVNTYNTAHWGDYNSAGGDCANFTSQGLYIRGIPMDSIWYSLGPGQASTTWVLAGAMDDWASRQGWDRLDLNQLDQLKLGDIAFFDWNNTGVADHVMTVSRIDSGPGGLTVFFVSHNDDGAYRELSEVITEQHPGANAWFYSVPLGT